MTKCNHATVYDEARRQTVCLSCGKRVNAEAYYSKNCAVVEETADGASVGRCWHYVGDSNVCPRHGDVSAVQARYQAGAGLTPEREHVREDPPARVEPEAEPWRVISEQTAARLIIDIMLVAAVIWVISRLFGVEL